MTIGILISIIVAVVGLITYALSTNGKVAEIGRILFFCGTLVSLFVLRGHRF